MPTHDIIDNRNEKLVDYINRILASTEAARFAVGYFFLSGLESIAERLGGVKELRLLIGNTTNRETLEQLAEGYRRLELVAETAEAQSYPKRTEARQMAIETAENIRSSVELMDQTDEGEVLVKTLARMIEEKQLKVRIYTKGRMHAKAYIFDYGTVFDERGRPVDRHEKGIAVVGSSNLTLSGVTHNTELNVIVQGNDNHAELVRWFEDLWKESQDFDEALIQEIQQSWAIAPVRPYDIYMKTLYTLIKDRLEGEDDKNILWDDEITKRLADFQKVAVRQAVQMVRDYGGAFVADVVGLGKSYIGAAIVKHFERTDHARPLIICPAPLVEMWERYNEVYQLNARVLSLGYLRENNGGANLLLEDVKYRDRDFVLIDESHNLRYPDTQRYKLVQTFLATGRRCCLLTASPRNKSAWDVYHQIKLFHQDDKTDLPLDPPNLKEYFRLIEKREKKLPDLLYHLQIRRLRKHVLRWYGFAADTQQPLREMNDDALLPYLTEVRRAYVIVGGRHQFFPKRELETIEYSIEETYQGLYQELRGYLGKPVGRASSLTRAQARMPVPPEDSEILDRTEQLNEEAMYAIYEKKGGQLELFDDEEEEFVDLNEAEEILRQLRRENPGEYERIASLRDGIRTAKPSTNEGLYVFCQAGRYQQLFLLDENGEVISRDIPRILGTIKCGPDQKGASLPAGYNKAVMQVKRRFIEEVKHRQAEREHTLSLTQGQRYVLRELRIFFGATTDEDEKAQVNILEKAFRGPMLLALNRELNLLRRNGVTSQELLKTLTRLYHQHNMRDWLDRRSLQLEDQQIPKIVYSEALV